MGKTLDNLEDISKIGVVEVTANGAAPQATTYTKTEDDTALGLKADQTAVDLKANSANPAVTGIIKEEVISELPVLG